MEIQKVGFVYTVERLGPDGEVLSVQTVHNIMPTVELNYMLSAAFTGGAQYSTWYLAEKSNPTPAQRGRQLHSRQLPTRH